MVAKKFIIEKKEYEWYTDWNLSKSSGDIADAYLYDEEMVVYILNKIEPRNLFRIELISLESYTVIQSLIDEITTWYNLGWDENKTWEDNQNKIRSFIQKECLDILNDSILNTSNYSLMIQKSAEKIGCRYSKLENSKIPLAYSILNRF